MVRALLVGAAALVLLVVVSLLLAQIPSPAPVIAPGERAYERGARGVHFQLRDGAAQVPWTAGFARASCTPLDGLGGVVRADGGSVRFNEPGTYLLQLTEMRDFQDVADFSFEVPEEGWRVVHVPLCRR